MAISFVAYATGASASANDGTVTVSVPSGTQNSDVMVLVVTTNNLNALTATGWTQSLQTVIRGGEYSYVCYRVASSEPGSYTFTQTTATMSAGIATYRGVLTSSVFDVSPVAGTVVTSGTSIVAPSITPSYGGSRMVCSFISRESWTFSTPTGMTERWDFNDGRGVYTQSLDDEAVSTGATGTRTSTTSGSIGFAAGGISMALRGSPVPFSQGLIIL